MSEFKFRMMKLKELKKDNGKEIKNLSPAEFDVLGAIWQLKIPCERIIVIDSFEGTMEEKESMIRNILEVMPKMIDPNEKFDDIAVIATVYISEKEFKPEEWRIAGEPVSSYDMLDLPVVPENTVLMRDYKLLKHLGFTCINEYVGYEHKKACIYKNHAGELIKNYFDECVKLDEAKE